MGVLVFFCDFWLRGTHKEYCVRMVGDRQGQFANRTC